MFRIDFNATALDAAIAETKARLTDMLPLFQDMGEYLIGSTRERFRQGVAPDGAKWLPKSAVTLARYKARGDGVRPDPLIGASRRLSTEILAYAQKASVEVGSNLEYSGVMQAGARQGAFGRDGRNHPIPWGNIPARPWLGLSDRDEVALVEIADEYVAPDGGAAV